MDSCKHKEVISHPVHGDPICKACGCGLSGGWDEPDDPDDFEPCSELACDHCFTMGCSGECLNKTTD